MSITDSINQRTQTCGAISLMDVTMAAHTRSDEEEEEELDDQQSLELLRSKHEAQLNAVKEDIER